MLIKAGGGEMGVGDEIMEAGGEEIGVSD